jgi:hypothetical protein
MKITYNIVDKTYSLSRLSVEQHDALSIVLQAASKRCFDEPTDEGFWYGSGDLACVLTDKEREALFDLCERLKKFSRIGSAMRSTPCARQGREPIQPSNTAHNEE